MLYASNLDRQHALRKLAFHRLVSRALVGPKGDELFDKAKTALGEMAASYGNTPFVVSWADLLSLSKGEVAKEIIRRRDEIETMRESSPFMRVFGFDLGVRMKIDMRDPEIRKRMFALAKRLATIDPHRLEAQPCKQMTPF